MRFNKALGHFRHDMKAYGWFRGAYMLWLKTRPKGTAPTKVFSHTLGGPAIVRPGTSDMAMFEQFELHPYLPITRSAGPINVLDLGANIGLSVLYWKHHCPLARVIAVEPDASNFAVLRSNTEGLKDVHLVQAGIWYRPGRLDVRREGVGNAGFSTNEQLSNGEVEATTIPELLARFQWDRVDILKVDIEGSELELFGKGDLSWIDRVGIIAIELHDRTRPGCGDAFFSAISGRSWNFSIHGEMIMCERRDMPVSIR